MNHACVQCATSTDCGTGRTCMDGFCLGQLDGGRFGGGRNNDGGRNDGG
jgi:hypothetical protein